MSPVKVLFAGGHSNEPAQGEKVVKRVDKLDVVTGQWSQSSLSVARGRMAAAGLATTIIFAGGSSFIGDYNVAYIYDSSTGLWSTAQLSNSGDGMTAATPGTKIIFCGGDKKVANVYDICSKTWTTIVLNKARSSAAAAATGNKLLIRGGAYDDSKTVDIWNSQSIIF